MQYEILLSATPDLLRVPVIWRLPGSGSGKTALYCGAAAAIGQEIRAMDAQHVLLVIGHHVSQTDAGAVVRESMNTAGISYDVYSDIPSEPHFEDALRLASAMSGKHYDAVVGVGGGSVLDLAKLAAQNTDENFVQRIRTASFCLSRLPLILVPTTAGTGSEVSPYAVMTVDGKKVFYTSPYLLPDIALVDPLLTVSMPPRTTAATAFDALTHAVEGAMGRALPFTSAIAAEVLSMVLQALPLAMKDTENIQARYDLAFASVMAMMGYAIGGGLYAHSVSYILTLEKNLPHGVGCGLALPFTMRLNAPFIRPLMKRLEAACSGRAPDEVIRALYIGSGLPATLEELGYREEDIPRLADLLCKQYYRKTNPRQLHDEDAQGLFRAMYYGV